MVRISKASTTFSPQGIRKLQADLGEMETRFHVEAVEAKSGFEKDRAEFKSKNEKMYFQFVFELD